MQFASPAYRQLRNPDGHCGNKSKNVHACERSFPSVQVESAKRLRCCVFVCFLRIFWGERLEERNFRQNWCLTPSNRDGWRTGSRCGADAPCKKGGCTSLRGARRQVQAAHPEFHLPHVA